MECRQLAVAEVIEHRPGDFRHGVADPVTIGEHMRQPDDLGQLSSA